MFRNKVNFHNLIAVCYIWASSGFITYLLSFYSKYFQGNFFLNFSISGLSDGISMMWIALLSMKLEMKGLVALCNTLVIVLSICLYFVMKYASPATELFMVPILLMAIRLQSAGIQSFGYQII